ncbi:MAG: hypothetical protein WC829_04560 [Hyphomicrobium sp.]|jgi:hypothetical protein
MSAEFQEVVDGKHFYHFSGIVQPLGKLSSQMLWNPPGSGVYFGIWQMWFYKSLATEINMKRRTSILGTGGSLRNSALFPGNGSGPASTPIEQYSDLTATAAPVANALLVFPKGADDLTFKHPLVFGPGEGVIVYPDTLQALNWSWSVMGEVTGIPA